VKASEILPPEYGKAHWRDAETKLPLSSGAAYHAITSNNAHLVEWLDESTLYPCLPTREEAEEWVNTEYPEWDGELKVERRVAFEMYDWIAERFNQPKK